MSEATSPVPLDGERARDHRLPLGRSEIERRIPHRGRMCLLDRLEGWTLEAIHCSADSHQAPDHPLRCRLGLLAPAAIEYAAQATALHQAVNHAHAADGSGAAARPGFIASARDVHMFRTRLDDVAGRLQVHAVRQHGDSQQSLYRFRVEDEAGCVLVEGRLTVVLDRPLVVEP